ncbi:MAG: uroporphyrinogen-III synthase, partial [Deltaproteobacteria bacterium]|nr:uroporphyrinogen-III synthase [Deltaproteobacteria bacterium]
TVTNFVVMFKRKALPQLLKSVKVACIGPITAKTAEKYGLKVDIMPEDYTIPALAEAMAGYFTKTSDRKARP